MFLKGGASTLFRKVPQKAYSHLIFFLIQKGILASEQYDND